MADGIDALVAALPPHECELTIEHNGHRSNYETVASWADRQTHAQWASDEERTRAITTDELWVIQWYPSTPVGFHCVAASTLRAALDATRVDETDDGD